MYISLNKSHPFWAYKGTILYITFPYMHIAWEKLHNPGPKMADGATFIRDIVISVTG